MTLRTTLNSDPASKKLKGKTVIDRSHLRAGRPASLALACVGFVASAPGVAQAPVSGSAPPPPPPAQDDAQGVELQGVTVTDSAIIDQGYKTDRAANPKFVAPLLDTPRSVVVIPRQLIEDTGSTTLVDALRTVPGITFGAAEGGNPVGDRPFIRGFDSQGSTFVDGVRDIGAQSRETFAVDEIQIVRGSDSTLGGRGTAGGSINIVSKLPKDEDFFRADASYGNADYKRVTGDVNYRITPTVAVRLAAMYHDQDFAGRDAIYSKRWGVAPSLTVGIGTPTRLTVGYYHLKTDELPDSGIPYLYTIGNTPNLGESYSEPAIGRVTTAGGATGVVKRSTFYGLKDRDFRNSYVDQFTIRAEHELGNGLTIRNTSRFSRTEQNYIFLLPDDSTGNVYGTTATNTGANLTNGGYVWRRANTRQGNTKSMINQSDIYGTFSTGSIRHSIAAGIELAWEDAVRAPMSRAAI